MPPVQDQDKVRGGRGDVPEEIVRALRENLKNAKQGEVIKVQPGKYFLDSVSERSLIPGFIPP
jgi:hypothetical protein